MTKTLIRALIVAGLAALPVRAIEIKPATAASFDTYIQAVEARMGDEISKDRFLAIDSLPESRRQSAYADLRRGKLYIEALHATDDGRQLHIKDGLLNHWASVLFIPGAKLSDVLAVLEDSNRQSQIYKPVIRTSKLLGRNGDQSQIYYQFFYKSVITVLSNAR